MASTSLRRLTSPSRVRPETLNVAPGLLGMPLATPARRAGAIVVDFGVLALLSASGASWIAAGIAALVFQLRRRRRAGTRRREAWLWLALAALVFVGLEQATGRIERWIDARWPAAPATTAATLGASAGSGALPAADAGRHVSAHRKARTPEPDNDNDTGGDDEEGATAQAAALAGAAAAAGSAPTPALREAALAARVVRLEAELDEARKPAAQRWRDDLLRRLRRLGVGFGWAAFYFTLLPCAWQGRTVGKWLFGLRIVELTGRPLSLMTCFGRYGGYAAAMATGGVGFAQILWDPNRQAIQDKVAHTVVIDERAARQAAGAAQPAGVALQAPGPAPAADAAAAPATPGSPDDAAPLVAAREESA
jgi:hypothetical protein